jgi:GNAT superfamily N-acetyltransferase
MDPKWGHPKIDGRNCLFVKIPKKEIMGCAGIEVDVIGGGVDVRAPLMSNLAVGRNFRRKGIAEDLVVAAEDLARKQWGFDSCYLYVEKKNTAAIKLYRKLGYKKSWEDPNATTLLPAESGGIQNSRTTLVCMKKRLTGVGAILDRINPF